MESTKKIYKYVIPILEDFYLDLPIQAKILAFQIQDESPVIWTLLDPCNDVESRRFSVRGTGEVIDSKDSDIYIGTVQKKHGFVWHLFEVMK